MTDDYVRTIASVDTVAARQGCTLSRDASMLVEVAPALAAEVLRLRDVARAAHGFMASKLVLEFRAKRIASSCMCGDCMALDELDCALSLAGCVVGAALRGEG